MACLVIELATEVQTARLCYSRNLLLLRHISVAANNPVLAPDFRAVEFDYQKRPILNSCCLGAATKQIRA